jgi:integration host factor subunit alpha
VNGAKMTKADIVERVSERCGISKKDSIEMVESVFNILKDTLENGEEIKISGFGKFEVKSKHARKGRNPQTGDAITIEARRILTFKPSTILKNTINSK